MRGKEIITVAGLNDDQGPWQFQPGFMIKSLYLLILPVQKKKVFFIKQSNFSFI